MKAWDIFSYQPPGWPDPHPCVIVSHPDRVANKPEVSVLMCSSQRAQREPKANEVVLDTSDGLHWETLCKCDLIHTVLKAALKHQRGHVTATRRRQIIDTITRCNGWI